MKKLLFLFCFFMVISSPARLFAAGGPVQEIDEEQQRIELHLKWARGISAVTALSLAGAGVALNDFDLIGAGVGVAIGTQCALFFVSRSIKK